LFPAFTAGGHPPLNAASPPKRLLFLAYPNPSNALRAHKLVDPGGVEPPSESESLGNQSAKLYAATAAILIP
jgi:hypothetical protein